MSGLFVLPHGVVCCGTQGSLNQEDKQSVLPLDGGAKHPSHILAHCTLQEYASRTTSQVPAQLMPSYVVFYVLLASWVFAFPSLHGSVPEYNPAKFSMVAC